MQSNQRKPLKLTIKKDFVEQVASNLPSNWTIKRNEVTLPQRDYYDIVVHQNGYFPREWFMWLGVEGGWGPNQLEVDALNLEEGFSPAIPLRFRPNAPVDPEKLKWTSSSAAYPLIEGARFSKYWSNLVSDGGLYFEP